MPTSFKSWLTFAPSRRRDVSPVSDARSSSLSRRNKNMDWLDLKQHACSEVRASNLSGDCHWVNEMFRGYFGVENGHQKCVRRRAELSTAMNPRCRDRDEAKRVVNEVFEQCFKDTRPFDDIP